MSFNYYEILGLSQGAGAAEIKAAYRSLAMRYHPDKNPSPDAHKQFVAINAAYEVLGDPLKRKLYDLRRQAGQVVYRTRTARPSSPTDPIDHEEMRRRFWSSPAGQKKKRALEKEANFFDKTNLILRIISIPILIFMLLILFDNFFPEELVNQEITYVKARKSGEAIDMRIDHQFQIGEAYIWARQKYAVCLKTGDRADISIGRIFHLITSVRLAQICKYSDGGVFGDTGKSQFIDPAQSLFSGAGSLIFLVLFLFGYLWWKSADPAYATGAAVIGLLISGVIVMLFMRLLP